ncbi:hypothetical protein Bhyg_16220 [Pseudolycoriella hygida]|uniref:Uncharacterized protein n=1 Tax=Pseudolycoriella hygida TaxID=35572 RepID=A0A9Q0MLW6_9DIPT|nr:hypothetical protein Bhyg_16220 [Pseudolycoriella hygida]
MFSGYFVQHIDIVVAFEFEVPEPHLSGSNVKTPVRQCPLEKSALKSLNQLDVLLNNNPITLTWVSGHSGIKGDEEAGSMTKMQKNDLKKAPATHGIPYRTQNQ